MYIRPCQRNIIYITAEYPLHNIRLRVVVWSGYIIDYFLLIIKYNICAKEVDRLANRVVMVNVPKIKELASEKNMTLKKLESVSGISNGTIRKWVAADARVDKLHRVANSLGTSIEDLLQKV